METFENLLNQYRLRQAAVVREKTEAFKHQIRAAEYHLAEELVCLTVDNTRQFEEFYDAVSETGFSTLHTHRLLYEAVLRRRDIFESSMVFLILSSWDTETDALLKELDQNGLQTVLLFITENESSLPNLSDFKNCTPVPVSPFAELPKEPGV